MLKKIGKREESLGKEKQTEETGGVTRRQLIAGAAVTAGVVGTGMLLPRSLQAVEVPKKWDREADVVIVGTGFAGLSAAIEAHDAGAKVILIEKSQVIGGNSVIASGVSSAILGEKGKFVNSTVRAQRNAGQN